jgi:DNA repair photolyase
MNAAKNGFLKTHTIQTTLSGSSRPENAESAKKANKTILRETHPFIISVSRATDIPAWYMDWFLKRWKIGYILWHSPYNPHFIQKVWFDKVQAVIFWTKDPQAVHRYLSEIDACSFLYYVQVTLNDYEGTLLEPGIPTLQARIAGFQALSQALGSHRVVWRFDPLLLSDTIDLSMLLSRVERLCATLAPYTEKLIVSFVQIHRYKGVNSLLSKNNLTGVREFTSHEKQTFLVFFLELERKYNLKIHICGEEQAPSVYSQARRGDCIDRGLHMELASRKNQEKDENKGFIHFLKTAPKDPGQRKACSCIHAKDIGQYSSCLHLCRYCYANGNDATVKARYQAHITAQNAGIDLPCLILQQLHQE